MKPVHGACALLLWLLALAAPARAASGADAPGPVLSHAAGFYDKAFFLRLSHPDPDVTIYYTLDGSDPDPARVNGVPLRYKNTYSYRRGDPFGEFLESEFRSHRYRSPLVVVDRTPMPDRYHRVATSLDHQEPVYFPEIGTLSNSQQRRNALIDRVNAGIDAVNAVLGRWAAYLTGPVPRLRRHEPSGSNRLLKATALRAAAFRDGQRVGPVVSATYFVMPRETFALPVVSLMAQEDLLFGYEAGILVAGKAHDDFRRQYPDQQRAGGTAPANWQQRGVEIPAHLHYFSHRNDPLRASVDQGIGVRVHGGATRYAPSKSLRLYARKEYGAAHLEHGFFGPPQKYKRLLLRNSGNDFNGSLFRDAATQVASEGLRFDTQAYQPTVVFLNGEYWGILNLREHMDAHYLNRVHGVKEKDLDLMDGQEADEGDDRHWKALLTYLRSHDLGEQVHYAHVETQVDIDNFIDYQIANIYANNGDWPHNNQRFWRVRRSASGPDAPPGHDGRWRWLMFDVDRGLAVTAGERLRQVGSDGANQRRLNDDTRALFIHLLKNPGFRERFAGRFADLLNTRFTPSRMTSIINGMRAGIEPEIDRHIGRWRTPQSRGYWEEVIGHKLAFVQQRPDIMRQQLVTFLRLPGEYQLRLDKRGAASGAVHVNQFRIDPVSDQAVGEPQPWHGRYFKGLPLRVQATPASCFSHWEGHDERASEIALRPDADIHLKAVFLDACPAE